MLRTFTLRAGLCVALLGAAALPAFGQNQPLGDEVTLDDDPAPVDYNDEGGLAGAEENPDAPKDFDEVRLEEEGPAVALEPTGYPIQQVLRPITLPARMSEIAVAVPTNFDPYLSSGVLAAAYGVTSRVQVGLRYGMGSFDEDGFTTGKALGADVFYLLEDWAAVQLSVPMYLDPFALGVTIGAPLKFRFTDKVSLGFGRDLVNIRVAKFFPDVADARANEANVALYESNTTTDDGDLRLLGEVIYQLSDALAFTGTTGMIARDFGATDAGVPLLAALTYSSSNMLDIGGRLGFGSLDDATGTLGLAVFVAMRI